MRYFVNHRFVLFAILLLPTAGCLGRLFADKTPDASANEPISPGDDDIGNEEPEQQEGGPFNLAWKTGGGSQVWSDVLVYSSWRIQRNAVVGHYRLLDPEDVRRAWGTLEQCQVKFAELKHDEKIPAPAGKTVVVLHGLWRHRQAMQPLCDHLAKVGGYNVVNVSYATTRASIGDHAATLASVVEGLGEVEELNFVGCSLGNLVIRRYLHDQTAGGKPLDRRIKRVVMLAPPNQGAQIARRFAQDAVVRAAWGIPGDEIADWEKLAPTLATPSCEFGIIAGGRGKPGRSPIIDGDDDYLLAVEETKLDGAKDFRLLPVTHTSIKSDPEAMKQTLAFLKNGEFDKPD